ncbi:replication protein RepA [Ramlibacter alkalitolerans]|uniref:RepA replicase n=1 Tax=Ramlibacter alkalitolerans TaxID=2039631 RepID=A0ABS1JUB9_9BURK|nr:replication protein RepA [Ramlibacter alkalitolerans]MBL0427802.1 RepA replicase [Ramlibacter alkalitolerans]
MAKRNPAEPTEAEDAGLILFPKAQKLFEEAMAIEAVDAQEAGSIGYMARALVQATIPHRDPGKTVPAWGRHNGDLSLVIRPGYTVNKKNEPVSLGYPYGTVPRLLLAWLSTEAVRTRERKVVLGETLSGFMRELGMEPTGGRNGSITRLREQMKRLFASSISINYATRDAWADAGFRISDKATIWWDPVAPEQAGLWQSSVVLSEQFFKEVVEHPVPIDLRALKVLRQSPLALDIYSWLTYRMFYLRRPTQVPWESLMMQFGSDYAEVRMFKRRFLEALKQVTVVYPCLVEPEKAGLKLAPSKTHVRKITGGGKPALDL